MNRFNTQALMYDYCLDKLGLRDVKITNKYDSSMEALGEASAQWDEHGNLAGKLKVKIRSVRDLNQTLDTIAHELTHIRQYVDGTAYFKGSNRLYAGTPAHYKYSDRLVEREARKRAKILTDNFIQKHWEDMSILNRLNILYFNVVKRN